MKPVWVDDWAIAFDGRDQTLTGVDRYRGSAINVEMQYAETVVMSGGALSRAFYSLIGKDGRRYVLGKKA